MTVGTGWGWGKFLKNMRDWDGVGINCGNGWGWGSLGNPVQVFSLVGQGLKFLRLIVYGSCHGITHFHVFFCSNLQCVGWS